MKFKEGDKVKILPEEIIRKKIPNYKNFFLHSNRFNTICGKEVTITHIDICGKFSIGSHYHMGNGRKHIIWGIRFNDDWIDDKPKTLKRWLNEKI